MNIILEVNAMIEVVNTLVGKVYEEITNVYYVGSQCNDGTCKSFLDVYQPKTLIGIPLLQWNQYKRKIIQYERNYYVVIVVVLTVLKQNAVTEQQCCQFIIASCTIHCSVERAIWCRWIKSHMHQWIIDLLKDMLSIDFASLIFSCKPEKTSYFCFVIWFWKLHVIKTLWPVLNQQMPNMLTSSYYYACSLCSIPTSKSIHNDKTIFCHFGEYFITESSSFFVDLMKYCSLLIFNCRYQVYMGLVLIGNDAFCQSFMSTSSIHGNSWEILLTFWAILHHWK